jgi:hypothetical protein
LKKKIGSTAAAAVHGDPEAERAEQCYQENKLIKMRRIRRRKRVAELF